MSKPVKDGPNVKTLANVKARSSHFVDRAQGEPPMVAGSGSLADFLLASPLRQVDTDFGRLPDSPREIDL